jgi:hypothetical protein
MDAFGQRPPVLTYNAQEKRFEFRCSFEQRHVAKRLRLAWDAENKCWYTDQWQKVGPLLGYADEEAANRIRYYISP